jgi:hypothetical protein
LHRASLSVRPAPINADHIPGFWSTIFPLLFIDSFHQSVQSLLIVFLFFYSTGNITNISVSIVSQTGNRFQLSRAQHTSLERSRTGQEKHFTRVHPEKVGNVTWNRVIFKTQACQIRVRSFAFESLWSFIYSRLMFFHVSLCGSAIYIYYARRCV